MPDECGGEVLAFDADWLPSAATLAQAASAAAVASANADLINVMVAALLLIQRQQLRTDDVLLRAQLTSCRQTQVRRRPGRAGCTRSARHSRNGCAHSAVTAIQARTVLVWKIPELLRGVMTATLRILAPLRPPARFLTGSTYVLLGFDALRAPGGRVDQAGPLLARLRKVVPLPDNDEQLVRANAAVQVVAGATLALGLAPRLSALALAGSLIPTTIAGHSYWNLEDPAARKVQRIQFHKNMAMLGGLLFAVLDQSDGG